MEKLAPNFPVAMETFRLMGEIISLYVELKERMRELDEEKPGQTDLEKIQYLFMLLGEYHPLCRSKRWFSGVGEEGVLLSPWLPTPS